MKRLSYFFCCWLMAGVVYASAVDQKQQLAFGLELIQQKKFTEAETHFLSLAKQFPEQISYRNNLAVVQMAQGKAQQALENLNSIIASDQFYSVTQKNINDIYAFMASQAYSKALDKEDKVKLPELAALDAMMPVKAAAEIVVENKPEGKNQQQLTTELITKTKDWAQFWMQGDIERYLASYSLTFKPSGNISYQDWKSQRRYRLKHSKQVTVSYNQVKVYFDSDQKSAIVEFVQKYSAGNYQDTVKKQLHWVLEAEGWRITQEQVIEQI